MVHINPICGTTPKRPSFNNGNPKTVDKTVDNWLVGDILNSVGESLRTFTIKGVWTRLRHTTVPKN